MNGVPGKNGMFYTAVSFSWHPAWSGILTNMIKIIRLYKSNTELSSFKLVII